MKKLVIIFLGVVFGLQVNAQLTFGPRAGLNLASIVGDNEDAKMKIGFQVGGAANYEISDMFSLQPGLLLSMKGVTDDLDEDEGKSSMSLGYLEIPVNAVANFSGFQVFAGPYVGLGLFGKSKWEYDGESNDTDIQFVSDYKDVDDDKFGLKRLDFGINAGLGYKMDALQIQAGYGLGLANMNPPYDGEDPEHTYTNSVIQFTVTFFLGE